MVVNCNGNYGVRGETVWRDSSVPSEATRHKMSIVVQVVKRRWIKQTVATSRGRDVPCPFESVEHPPRTEEGS